jgi:hypothetical protein
MAQQYTNVGGLHPKKSAFDLTHEMKFTCGFGRMIPILCEHAIPGDIWKIGNEIVARFQPMVTPMLHDVRIKVDYYFVPDRLLWPDWEDWATGGPDGDNESLVPLYDGKTVSFVNDKYSLWDYFGFPVGVNPTGFHPVLFPCLDYDFIHFEYFRDENFQELSVDGKKTNDWKKRRDALLNGTNYSYSNGGNFHYPRIKSWQKDYFTSAQPRQQRGTSPAIPLVGESKALFTLPNGQDIGELFGVESSQTIKAVPTELNYSTFAKLYRPDGFYDSVNREDLHVRNTGGLNNILNANNTVDLGQVQGADIDDIRSGFALQHFLERNQRAGARYTEWIKAHYGNSPRDDRLDRPEYIGGTRTPIIVSEVIQTSEDGTTPQGNLAGHGLTADKNYLGGYRVQEFGIIMGILTVQPKLSYMSQGIHKQWLFRERYDLPLPEFVNLSEQPIHNVELFATNDAAQNAGVFGYQGIYDEHRTRFDRVAGDMRGYLDTWHMARKFDSPPNLNAEFLLMQPQLRPFHMTQDWQHNVIINMANVIKAIRPLPFMAEPGLLDHH